MTSQKSAATKAKFSDLDLTRFTSLYGMPMGYDAWVLADLTGQNIETPIVYVASDDSRLSKMRECLNFFATELDCFSIPAWDCLPYDRVSPRAELVGQRIASLSQLTKPIRKPSIILLTANSMLQRVIPRTLLLQSQLSLSEGMNIELPNLIHYLEHNGFIRNTTVLEVGDYALRGGILDIFPSGERNPIRLDFFGQTLESLRSFNAETQRSELSLKHFLLSPVSETFLNSITIKNFCSGYRRHFGPRMSNDLMLESISEGRRYPGMEHWLPLFHEKLETIFDFLPESPIVFDDLAEAACRDRWEAIQDYYQARIEEPKTIGGFTPDKYNALSPELLFVTEEEHKKRLSKHPVVSISPFSLESNKEQKIIDLSGKPGPIFLPNNKAFAPDLFLKLSNYLKKELIKKKRTVIAAWSLGTRERIYRMLHEQGVENLVLASNWKMVQELSDQSIALVVLPIERGFASPWLTIVSEQDILGDRLNRQKRKRRATGPEVLTNTSELSQGDLVVHSDHGIGRYDGLETLDVENAPHDCLRLLYDGDDRLLIPVENIELLSRYGSADQPVTLDKLGGVAWQIRKARLKKRIKEMAQELMKVAAQRSLKSAPILNAETAVLDQFCSSFPYMETDDQVSAIEETLADMGSGRPMDRLICGDVGFGKTEIALRAAFVAIMSKKQVAILVPTTLLCRQHYQNFCERFQNFPVRVEQLSRLVKSSKAMQIRDDIRLGKVDIVIGTHALLHKSISFVNLGLMIVDEEQHFGVGHKERLKSLRADIHVLTLSATPIPRTLQMALTGVRDMSIISTPPIDRLAVRTFITQFDPIVVRDALMREHLRGGQSFFVCPRISDLDQISVRIAKLCPELKFQVAHGGMAITELEKVMEDFYNGEFDVLIATAIIESGLDLPRVNTMIIHRADMFGLSQLYQLRGRIGRSKLRGYAYFMLPQGNRVTPTARKRLEVINRLDSLGSGFSLASYDMDIRGAGNLLGGEQSGHIREVGIELYQNLLQEAVAQLRSQSQEEIIDRNNSSWSPQISLGTAVLIPDSYISDLDLRLSLYRRASKIEDEIGIANFSEELVDRFGPIPQEFRNLIETVAIKGLCRAVGISRIDAGPRGAIITFHESTRLNTQKLIELVGNPDKNLTLRPDNKLIVSRKWPTAQQRLDGVRSFLDFLSKTMLQD